MNEKTVESIYNRILNEIVIPVVGNKITYSNDLDAFGRTHIGKEFVGVFSSDRMPTHGYSIINVDKSHESGSHWLGIVFKDGEPHIYDSYGRRSSDLIPHIGGAVDADYDREQGKKEENCGARSLTWLICVKYLGLDNALKI